jgi:hypothetical protein
MVMAMIVMAMMVVIAVVMVVDRLKLLELLRESKRVLITEDNSQGVIVLFRILEKLIAAAVVAAAIAIAVFNVAFGDSQLGKLEPKGRVVAVAAFKLAGAVAVELELARAVVAAIVFAAASVAELESAGRSGRGRQQGHANRGAVHKLAKRGLHTVP